MTESSYFWTSVNQFKVCFSLAWDHIENFFQSSLSFHASILFFFLKKKRKYLETTRKCLMVISHSLTVLFSREWNIHFVQYHWYQQEISTGISEIQFCYHMLLLLFFLPSSVSHSYSLKHWDIKQEPFNTRYKPLYWGPAHSKKVKVITHFTITLKNYTKEL